MFSLIITIIAVVLVIAIAAAAIFYGGDVFRGGSAKSHATAMVTACQQMGAAQSFYQASNAGAYADYTTLTTASNGYMSGPPSLPPGHVLASIDTTTGVITGSVSQAFPASCDAINVLAGGTASAGIAKTAPAGAVFGCSGPGTAPYVFTFHE